MSLLSHLDDFSSLHGFRPRSLESVGLDRAYALVQLSAPHLGYADWRQKVEGSSSAPWQESAWIGLEDPRQLIHAVFFCQLITSRPAGSVLHASDLIAVDLPGPPTIDAALDCVACLAKRTGARVLELDFDGDKLERALERMGRRLKEQGWGLRAKQLKRLDLILQ